MLAEDIAAAKQEMKYAINGSIEKLRMVYGITPSRVHVDMLDITIGDTVPIFLAGEVKLEFKL